MRVLHVLPTRAAEYGGPIRVAMEFARQLAPHGIDCELFPEDGVEPPQRLVYYPGLRGSISLAGGRSTVPADYRLTGFPLRRLGPWSAEYIPFDQIGP